MNSRYRIVALSLAMLLAACENSVKLAEGEYYRIPPENDLQNTFAASYVRSVYGASDSPDAIGVVFNGSEVAKAIPGFKEQVQGYPGKVDSSPSATIKKLTAAGEANFEQALRDNIARLGKGKPLVPFANGAYAKVADDNGMFDLHAPDGGWHRSDMIPPGCNRSPAQVPSVHYDSCLFRVRRAGYDLGFWLNGENVAHADAFADFVLARLSDWRVRPES